MSHYQDAETLLRASDASAVKAMEALHVDPTAAAVLMAGSVASILAAQVHATLALVDAQRGAPITEGHPK